MLCCSACFLHPKSAVLLTSTWRFLSHGTAFLVVYRARRPCVVALLSGLAAAAEAEATVTATVTGRRSSTPAAPPLAVTAAGVETLAAFGTTHARRQV